MLHLLGIGDLSIAILKIGFPGVIHIHDMYLILASLFYPLHYFERKKMKMNIIIQEKKVPTSETTKVSLENKSGCLLQTSALI